MELNKLRLSQIDTSDIESSDFGSKTQINSVSSNLDAFASYANSTFSTGGGGTATGNGVVFSDTFTTSNVSSNEFSLSSNVSYGENLLVYLNGLLQHPDAYSVSANTLTLINTDPLPSGLKVSVRELSVAGGVSNITVANASTARSSNLANGALLFDYEGSNLYVYDGSVEGGYYLSLTQAVIPAPEYSFQGSVSGYSSGGIVPPSTQSNIIDKFPFASDGNATDVGDLTQARSRPAGQSSSISGYTSGGSPIYLDTIDKFSFATNANATDVGDLTQARYGSGGQSSSSSGYSSGGGDPAFNTIDKIPFAADANASDIGDLSQSRWNNAGQSSAENGYTSGGTSPTASNVIDKFPFSSDTNATDVGDLTQGRYGPTGQSSTTSGYSSGGSSANIIDKFPFAADGNATDVGDLTISSSFLMGQSSTVSGYATGSTTIDKFPFATDSNATDIGNLSVSRLQGTGQQV